MSPFYPPLPAPQPANVMGSALAGYGAVQDAQTSQSQNALAQMRLQQAQRGESALAEYGKTRDVEAATNIDPATGMALAKHVAEISDKERATLKDKIAIFDKHKANAIGNPEVYQKMITELGPEASKMFVAPDKFAAMSPSEQQNVLFKGEQIAESLKHAMTQYQATKLSQVDIPKAQAYIGGVGERTSQGRERVEQGWQNVDINRKKLDKPTKPEDPVKAVRSARSAMLKDRPFQDKIENMSPDEKAAAEDDYLSKRIAQEKRLASGGGKGTKPKPLNQLSDTEIQALINAKTGAPAQ